MSKGMPRWADLFLVPASNVVLAFFVAGLVVLFIGENPIRALQIMLEGALGADSGLGYTLFYTTSFIFTGLAVAIAFQASIINIGGEGQAYVGGLGVAQVCLRIATVMPWWVIAPLAALGGAVDLVSSKDGHINLVFTEMLIFRPDGQGR